MDASDRHNGQTNERTDRRIEETRLFVRPSVRLCPRWSLTLIDRRLERSFIHYYEQVPRHWRIRGVWIIRGFC